MSTNIGFKNLSKSQRNAVIGTLSGDLSNIAINRKLEQLEPLKSSIEIVKIMLFSCLINFSLNFILVPKFSLIGAAIAGLTSNFMLIFYAIFALKKIVNFKFFSKDFLKILLNSISLLCFILVCGLWVNFHNQLHLIFLLLFASIFYISIDIFFRKNSIFKIV